MWCESGRGGGGQRLARDVKREVDGARGGAGGGPGMGVGARKFESVR